MFWSSDELAELQASSVVNKIGKADAESMFTNYLDLFHDNVDQCHQVASVIMAYAFDIPEVQSENKYQDFEDDEDDLVSDDDEDELTTLSLVPLADMLNADGHLNNAHLCCDNEDLEMRTTKRIVRGEEILNDYGQLPQSDLLRRYGYVSENYAAFDVTEVSTQLILSTLTDGLDVSEILLPALDDEHIRARLEFAKREGVYEDSYDISHSTLERPCIPDELLAYIYILLLSEQSFDSMLQSNIALPSRSKLATELVGRMLVVIFRKKEAEYATTKEEDEALSGVAAHRTFLALQVRLGEKRVLRSAIEEASKMSASNKSMRAGGNNVIGTSDGGHKKRKTEEILERNRKGRRK